MRVVDFFCGAGGFSEGFSQAGFDIIKAFDIWGPAIETHNANHIDGVAEYGDVIKISKLPTEEFHKVVPDSEVIIGSPPCVAFSNSNKSGKADKELGIDLIKAYLRIIARKKYKKDSKLKYWVFENVINVHKYLKDSYTLEELEVEDDLVESSDISQEILLVKSNENSGTYNLKYYGVPSNRNRYFCGEFPKIKKTHNDNNLITLGDVLNSLGKPYEKVNSYIIDPNYKFKMAGDQVTDHHYIRELANFEWEKAKRQKRDKGYMGKMSFPENLDKPARTIMATMSYSSRESMILKIDENERYRLPTIREVATVMTFPISYNFYGNSDSVKHKLVGNSVPPKFSKAIATAIAQDANKKHGFRFDNKVGIEINTPQEKFYNLNFNKFEIKKEKEKKFKTKFKYHVPYLIEKSYRVELINEFKNNQEVKWKVLVHKGSGKNAKVYEDLNSYPSEVFKDLDTVNSFVQSLISKIGNSKNLQLNYCETRVKRKKAELIGPEELLEEIKHFILNNIEKDNLQRVKNLDNLVPRRIIGAYTVLSIIIRRLNNGDNDRRVKD